jgi:hypothetical protein
MHELLQHSPLILPKVLEYFGIENCISSHKQPNLAKDGNGDGHGRIVQMFFDAPSCRPRNTTKFRDYVDVPHV